MNTREKLAALIAAQKNGEPVPAWAGLSQNALGRERTQAGQEPPGLLVQTRPGNQETRSLSDSQFPNQEDLESLKAKKRPEALDPAAVNAGALKNAAREADLLFERYGDVMAVVDNHPTFRKATAPVTEGGWGIYPQALTRACVEYSVDGDYSTGVTRVLDALRYTANYRAARDKGKFLFAVLRNGKQAPAHTPKIPR